MLDRRKRMSAGEVANKSRAISERLFSHDFFLQAKVVHFYVSFKNEVDTHSIIRKTLSLKKRVVVPCIHEMDQEMILSELIDFQEDLKPNRLGILEPDENSVRPVHPMAVDLMIVPGVAFDPLGSRIGYGKGYYDRLLSRTSNALVVGLAYDFQILDVLPALAHDVRMGKIITESRTIELNREETAPK